METSVNSRRVWSAVVAALCLLISFAIGCGRERADHDARVLAARERADRSRKVLDELLFQEDGIDEVIVYHSPPGAPPPLQTNRFTGVRAKQILDTLRPENRVPYYAERGDVWCSVQFKRKGTDVVGLAYLRDGGFMYKGFYFSLKNDVMPTLLREIDSGKKPE